MSDYFAPYIDASGPHFPTYQNILDKLVEVTKTIFGQDIYLGVDSKDYQFLSVIALAAYDDNQGAELAYNGLNPTTAIGASLSKLVKYNGLRRIKASFSECDVTITGLAGTVITSGVVSDISGNKWDLPSPLVILSSGILTATAICRTVGAVTALMGTLTTIDTPTSGWISVTNAAAAIPGTASETDAQLRARQAISAALPSLTLLDGTKARILALTGVTRSHVYENFTDEPDDNNLDPHSIWAVVEGGEIVDIAQAIYDNKGFCGLNGDIDYTITGTDGTEEIISFSRPTPTPIYVIYDITSLPGYTTATATAIIAAAADYINSLEIGEDLTISGLYGAALSVMPNLARPIFSITEVKAAITSTPTTTVDIEILFDHVAQGAIANISIVEPS